MPSGITSRGSLTLPVLRQRLAGLGDPPFRARLSQVLAASAGKLVNDGFRTSTNPYGKRWQALKYRRGQPLLDTGRLRASVTAVPLSNGFRIDATASYGRFHQFGTRGRARRAGGTGGGIPRRQFIPAPDTGGLPEKWRVTFDRETVKAIERQAAGRAV